MAEYKYSLKEIDTMRDAVEARLLWEKKGGKNG